jgi:hypothetical protein
MPAEPKKDKKPAICTCTCPYCDVEVVVEDAPFCQICKVSFGRCPKCGALIMEKTAIQCHSCGTTLS